MPIVAYIAHFLSLLILAPVIANPGDRWSLVEDGYATGGANDVLMIVMFIVFAFYAMYYTIPIVQSVCDHGGEFVFVSVFIAAASVGFLWILIKGQWISLGTSSEWAWAAVFVASAVGAYAVIKGEGGGSLVGLKFLLWFSMFIGPGSLIYNPSGWSLINNAHASGGKGDYLVGAMLIAGFIMVLWCGAKIIEACKNGGAVFSYQCIALSLIFVFFLLMSISNGLVAIDTSAGWTWCGMVLASIIGALAIAKSEQDEG